MNILELNCILQRHGIQLISYSEHTYIYIDESSLAEYIIGIYDANNISDFIIKRFEQITGLPHAMW